MDLIFPTWLMILCIIIIFPLVFFLLTRVLFKINLKDTTSRQLALETVSIALLVICTIIAIDIVNNSLIPCLIIFGIAIIIVFFIFYTIVKNDMRYKKVLKEMTTNIDCGIQEITAASEQITMSAQSISQKALDINTSSENIKSLLDVLEHISSQINLLALNATIEAGRLGDEARGFMAVASELQKLHEQTKTQIIKSTIEVKTIIKEIQDFSEHTSEITSATEEQTSSMEEIMELVVKLSKEVER